MACRPEPASGGLALVLVTPGDREPRQTLRLIREALRGGVTAVLLREPQLDARARAALARDVREATRKSGAWLLMHREIDLALAIEADAVHTGHGGPSVEQIRSDAPGLLAGRSCHWPVTDADRRADYVLLSPFRPTLKSHSRPLLERDQVQACLNDPGIPPIVALGGLTAAALPDLPMGLAGVAVVRALADAPDVCQAAAALIAARDFRPAVAPNRGRTAGA